MATAKHYHLNFRLVTFEDGTRNPYIQPDKNSSGYSINSDIALFIGGLGSREIDYLIERINYLQSFNPPIHDNVIEGGYGRIVEIYFQPPRAVLNGGGEDVIVPLQDFIDILNEWKDYLNSLPFQHTLSNR